MKQHDRQKPHIPHDEARPEIPHRPRCIPRFGELRKSICHTSERCRCSWPIFYPINPVGGNPRFTYRKSCESANNGTCRIGVTATIENRANGRPVIAKMSMPGIQDDRHSMIYVPGNFPLQPQRRGKFIHGSILCETVAHFRHNATPVPIFRRDIGKYPTENFSGRLFTQIFPDNPGGGLGYGHGPNQGLRVGMRDQGTRLSKRIEIIRRSREEGPYRRNTHGRSVAGRIYPTTPITKTKPQFDTSTGSRHPDTGRQRGKPPFQTAAQSPTKTLSRIWMSEQALGNKQGVLGVIADHAATKSKAMPPRPRKHPPGPGAGNTFRRQTDSITDRRPDKQSTISVS